MGRPVTPDNVKSLLAALSFAAFLPTATMAQTGHWVQVEAHPTLRTAEEFAVRYQERFGNVGGFRLPGGWYALALGPFETADEADAVRRQLLSTRAIPSDAYITDDTVFTQQFWPVGAARQPAPSQPASSAAAEPEATTPEPQATTGTPDPVAEPAPVVIPEETVAEARAAESRLNREERAEIQTALQWFGFYTQAIDAAFGPGTRNAISNWQEAQGAEGTGFLTTRQRMALVQGYEDELARFAFDPWRDERAGIEITLPTGLLAFDRIESPFVHFDAANDSGMRALLISQDGTQATLFGLYEIMQTLEVVPLEGARERGSNGFLLTGQSDTARAHVVARLQGGSIKGWALFWGPEADADAELVLSTMESSFRAIDGVLPGGEGAAASTVARRDLLSGLEVRRPLRARSGFFTDARGTVVTTSEAVQGCERVTIDEAYRATVVLDDAATGVAVLTPAEPLVPLAFAQFAQQDPGLDAAVRVSGFSYQDTLTRPILTIGRLSDMTGLAGEADLRRLTIDVQEGDTGGPVFDSNGSVMGMLLPAPQSADRVLPEDLHFALSGNAILNALEQAELRGAHNRANAAMPNETLTRVSADLTVLVSCWN